MRWVLLMSAVLCLLAGVTAPRPAVATDCAWRTPAEHRDLSHLVVLGTVVSAGDAQSLLVERVYKGERVAGVTVYSGAVLGQPSLRVGDRWLLFLYRDGKGRLLPGPCSPNRLLKRGEPLPADLAAVLEPGQAPPLSPWVWALGTAGLLLAGGAAVWLWRRRSAALLLILLQLAGCARPAPPPEPVEEAKPALRAALSYPPAIAVSPTGEWVASGHGGLTLIDPRGAASTLTARGKNIWDLAWSPTGEWLLAAGAGPVVFLVHAPSGRVRDLSPELTGLQEARLITAWSPDGSRALLAEDWISAHRDDQTTLWEIMPTTGTVRAVRGVGRLSGLHWLQGEKAVLLQSAGCCGPQGTPIDVRTGQSAGAGFFARGAFAPDGRHFAHQPYMGAHLTVSDLSTGENRTFWRDAPPGEPVPEKKGNPDWGYQIGAALWSSDSRKLAYAVNRWAAGSPAMPVRGNTLRILDLAGSGPEKVYRDFAGAMAWLGGGDLLFAAHTEEGMAVHLGDRVVARHASGIRLGFAADPIAALSRDGRRVAYAVTMPGNASELHVVDLKSGAVHQVPESSGLAPLNWTADGQQLITARFRFEQTELPAGGGAEGWALQEIFLLPLE